MFAHPDDDRIVAARRGFFRPVRRAFGAGISCSRLSGPGGIARGALGGFSSCPAFGFRQRFALNWNFETDQPLYGSNVSVILGNADRYRDASAAGSACSSDAVDVVFRIVRHIEIEHMADIRDVQAARGHVGSDEEPDGSILEFRHCSGSHGLIQISVDRGAIEAVFRHRLVKDIDVRLPVAEDDGVLQLAFALADHLSQCFPLVLECGCFPARLDD